MSVDAALTEGNRALHGCRQGIPSAERSVDRGREGRVLVENPDRHHSAG